MRVVPPMNDVATTTKPTTISIAGADIEVLDRGQGAPILFLQSSQGITAAERFLELLAKNRRVIAPSHPGFGQSTLPDWLDSVDDIAHIYLELMDRLDLKSVDVVGCSIGGWIAADMATKTPERIEAPRAGRPGRRKGGHGPTSSTFRTSSRCRRTSSTRCSTTIRKRARRTSRRCQSGAHAFVRNRETLALLGWEPYMHNPKLKHRLHRVTRPGPVGSGRQRRLVSAEYLAQLCGSAAERAYGHYRGGRTCAAHRAA